jgi:UDP-N-acetylglucosamine 2-epimerase (non-hydrolysing)
MTILGTRPEIIRLSLIIKLLDAHADHVLAHTGQNYDERLSDLFFQELNVRRPDVFMNVTGATFGTQAGEILARSEALFLEHRPDRVLILGDTNSGLGAIVARRLSIPVYHLEAGNRCYDFRVPEESNRRIIDHVSSVLMPYTNRSRDNLLHEGISSEDIFVTGNPIREVMEHFADKIAASAALSKYCVQEKPGNAASRRERGCGRTAAQLDRGAGSVARALWISGDLLASPAHTIEGEAIRGTTGSSGSAFRRADWFF